MKVATEIVELLRPVTERIEICGSLRRGKLEVGDVELLFQPKIDMVADGLFDQKPFNRTDDKLDSLLRSGYLEKRPNVKGHFAWGTLNKLALHKSSGIPVDLFTEPNPEDWMRSLIIRTGSSDYNIRLIQSAAKLGIHVGAYGIGLRDKNDTRIPCNSEEEFQKICGIKPLLPYQRTA